MKGESLPANIKPAPALRRLPRPERIRLQSACGNEGDVCAFELPRDGTPITVESPTGRIVAIAPGEVFFGDAGVS
jgi:hypothetical protein